MIRWKKMSRAPREAIRWAALAVVIPASFLLLGACQGEAVEAEDADGPSEQASPSTLDEDGVTAESESAVVNKRNCAVLCCDGTLVRPGPRTQGGCLAAGEWCRHRGAARRIRWGTIPIFESPC
jgi:hypothetical protein